jgi:uncharacterized protein YodC (DUF2158 family)
MYEQEFIEINDEDRYEIQLREHVEDWNISEADDDCGWFNTLGEAVEAFKKNGYVTVKY